MKQVDVKSVEVVGTLAPAPVSPLDLELEAQPARPRLTTEYKLRVLREAGACSHGELGGLLRRETLYLSHVGELAGLSPQKSEHKPAEPVPSAAGNGDAAR